MTSRGVNPVGVLNRLAFAERTLVLWVFMGAKISRIQPRFVGRNRRSEPEIRSKSRGKTGADSSLTAHNLRRGDVWGCGALGILSAIAENFGLGRPDLVAKSLSNRPLRGLKPRFYRPFRSKSRGKTRADSSFTTPDLHRGEVWGCGALGILSAIAKNFRLGTPDLVAKSPWNTRRAAILWPFRGKSRGKTRADSSLTSPIDLDFLILAHIFRA